MGKVAVLLAVGLVFSSVCFAEDAVTGHTIAVDKNIKDWTGVAPEQENSAAVSNGEYIWKDAAGDDTGNGKYTYPLDKALKKGADLKEFRVTFDKENLYILIKTDRPGDWWTGYKVIGIHKEGVEGGTQVLAQGDPDELNFDSGTFANLKAAPALSCQYVVAVSSTYKGRIYDEKGKMIARKEAQPDDTAGFKVDDFNWNAVEIAIPLSLIGGSPAGQTWKFIVAVGQQDNDIARKVLVEQSQYNGGGGAENGENPSAYDLAGADKATQEKDLGSYDPNASEGDLKGLATIEKSFLTVNFAK
ncbi:MAG: glucodextranase DOMON-like domain-containing protein [Candidatus Omnitrophota bacterium]|jgi:hypothetical protein